ncbi:MAG: hypothetical protein KKB25_02850 [Nanoarchaeota archaeon]|nr:hypothetical protein [Nanoarchaeota archaeon]
MKIKVEYKNPNIFVFEAMYDGNDAKEKYKLATKVIDEKLKNFEMKKIESVLKSDTPCGYMEVLDNIAISLEGIYQKARDVEELRKEVAMAFS